MNNNNNNNKTQQNKTNLNNRRKKCFETCPDQLLKGQRRVCCLAYLGWFYKKLDSATQWNEEGKPSLCGKQEQSLV